MPGIFGAACVWHPIRDMPLDEVARRLVHGTRLTVSSATSADGRAHVGAADLQVLRGSGIVHQAIDGSLAVVHGEIRGMEHDDAGRALLESYRSDPRRLERFSGSYVLAIWDAPQSTLVLANDRFGLRNLYYAVVGDTLVFAPLVGALLGVATLPRHPDVQAVADLLAFQHVTGDRTLLRAVHALPPGTIATFDAGGLDCRCRWRPGYRQPASLAVDDYVDELAKRLRQAVARCAAPAPRPGLALSGGLDSRALLTVLNSGGRLDTPCFTYGVPRCVDLTAATRLASCVGAPHHVFPLEPGYVAQRASELVRLTDGMHLALNGHATALQQCAQWCDVLLLGNGGDSLLDGFWKGPDVSPASDAFVHGMYARMNCGVDRSTARYLVSPTLLDEFDGGLLHRLRERLARYPGESAADVADAYNAGERHWRWVLQGVPGQSTHVEFRQPFFDDEIVEFALGVPAALRVGRRLHVELIRRYAPDLAAVPRTGTGRSLLAPSGGPGLIAMRRKQVMRRLRRVLSLPTVPAVQRLDNFSDYGFELRGASRSYVHSVLLDPRTEARGLYRAGGLRRLLAEHDARLRDHTVPIGIALSLELWFRSYLD